MSQMSLLDPQIRGKTALVSAAAQGIGRGVCVALAELGANVVCLDLESQRAGGEKTVRAAPAPSARVCPPPAPPPLHRRARPPTCDTHAGRYRSQTGRAFWCPCQVELLKAAGGDGAFVPCDATSREQIQAACEAAAGGHRRRRTHRHGRHPHVGWAQRRRGRERECGASERGGSLSRWRRIRGGL